MDDAIRKAKVVSGTIQKKCHGQTERSPMTRMDDQDLRQEEEADEEDVVEAETTEHHPTEASKAKARLEAEKDHRIVGEGLDKATEVVEATDPISSTKVSLRTRRTQLIKRHSHQLDTFMHFRQVE